MKARMLLSSVLAAGLLLTAGAQAHDRDHGDRDDRHYDHHDSHYRGDWHRDDRRHYEVRNYGRYRYEGPRYYARPYPYWPAYYPRRSYYYGNPYGYYGGSGVHGSISVNVPLF